MSAPLASVTVPTAAPPGLTTTVVVPPTATIAAMPARPTDAPLASVMWAERDEAPAFSAIPAPATPPPETLPLAVTRTSPEGP